MKHTGDGEHKTKLFLGLGRVLQIGYHWNSRMHKHSAILLIFSKTPLAIRIANGDWQHVRALILNSNVLHEIRYPDETLVSLRIVPFRRRGAQLRNHVLKGREARELNYNLVSGFLEQLHMCHQENCHNAYVFQICEQMIDTLSGNQKINDVIDSRIIAVMNRIQKKLQGHISARELAASVFLSEDRFLHLFKEQLGIPLRQYIIYQRTMFASNALLQGQSICRAADSAGFSDCAHFTRTFVDLNGLKPSDIIKQRDNIHSYLCTSTSCIHSESVSGQAYYCRDCRFFLSKTHNPALSVK